MGHLKTSVSLVIDNGTNTVRIYKRYILINLTINQIGLITAREPIVFWPTVIIPLSKRPVRDRGLLWTRGDRHLYSYLTNNNVKSPHPKI